MSLLPNQILPENVPFGRIDKDEKTVIVEHNWWLFLYNIYLNSVAINAAANNTGSATSWSRNFLTMGG